MSKHITAPVKLHAERDPYGTGGKEHTLYRMPVRDPHDMWASITSGERGRVPCPVDGCEQYLVWYEAGYVPGYRVCMAPAKCESGAFVVETIRHRFTLDYSGDFDEVTLILE